MNNIKRNSAKNDVMKMIEKKKSFTRKGREASSRRTGHMKMIADFIQEFEKVKSTSTNAAIFHYELERISNAFERRLRALDPFILIRIIWNNAEDEETEWNKLAMEGIYLTWSDKFLEKNPSFDKEAYIDVMVLLLEGYLGD